MQYYRNTTITLSSADPAFSSTLGVGQGVIASELVTPDGGKTWKVDSIEIPPMSINADGNPVTHTQTSTRVAAATSTAKAATTTTLKSAPSTAKVSTTSTKVAETQATSTKAAPASTKAGTSTKASAPAATTTGTVQKWGQCGGQGYTGPTACVAGSTCTFGYVCCLHRERKLELMIWTVTPGIVSACKAASARALFTWVAERYLMSRMLGLFFMVAWLGTSPNLYVKVDKR
jgi:hypothetical protein